MSERLADLAAALGYPDGPSERLIQAMTHRSFANEEDGCVHNERLEFLGDAVVGLVVAQALMAALPDVPEGTLSRLRAGIVNATSLSGLARDRGLGRLLRLGRGELRTGGRDKENILSDAYEAMIGALYLDRGLDAAREILLSDVGEALTAGAHPDADRDFKTRLQEWSQATLQVTPTYRPVSAEGPDHQKVFTVELDLDTLPPFTGSGRSKKLAERDAARAAWEHLRAEGRLRDPSAASGAPAPAGTGSPSPASPPGGS